MILLCVLFLICLEKIGPYAVVRKVARKLRATPKYSIGHSVVFQLN